MADQRHPPSSYDTKYPFNRVTVTESGHEEHYDDTPGAERTRFAHKSGTYREVSANGRMVEMVVGGRYDYHKQGHSVTTDGNHDHKVGGSHRTSISGDTHAEVNGTSTSAVNGDHKMLVGGDHVTAINGDSVHGVVGQMTMKLGKGFQIKGDSTIDSGIDGAANVQFGSTLSINAVSDVTITSATKITLVVGSSTIEIGPDHVYIDATTVVLSQSTYVGMASKGSTDGGVQVETISGPAKQAFALPGG